MKIIKHGKNYIRYSKCDCGCELEYNRDDIKAYKEVRDSRFCIQQLEVKIKKNTLKNENIKFYVTCPECGNRISVEREI